MCSSDLLELAIGIAKVGIDALHKAVNAIRAARRDLDAKPAAAPAKVRELDARLTAIEEALMQVNMKGSEADLAFPGMLNEQYATFAVSLEDGDTLPTRPQQDLYASLHEKLEAQLALWRTLNNGPLAALGEGSESRSAPSR